MVQLTERNLEARARHLREATERAGPDLAGRRCLVVGSGTGYNVDEFGRDYEEVHSLEVSHRRFSDTVDQGVMADGTFLPYRDDVFDVAIAVSVVEHVRPPERRPDLVREMVRCTAPGGHVVFQIPNHRFVVEVHTGLPFVQWVPGGTALAARFGYENLRDIHIPSPRTLAAWAEGAGATVIASRGITYPAEALPQYRTAYGILDRLGVFRVMPFGYLIVGRVESRPGGDPTEP